MIYTTPSHISVCLYLSVIRNGHSCPLTNPGQNFLHFTEILCSNNILSATDK